MKQQVSNKLRNYSTEQGFNVNRQQNDLRRYEDALRKVGKSNEGRELMALADVDSTVSRRGLMQRKLLLMKMMLKNEKNANQLMKEKIGRLGRDIHADNYAVRELQNRRKSKC